MITNKLGLEIDRINAGLTKVLGINDDQAWTKYVRDVRKELENVENLSSSSAVLMLTGIPIGHLITIASFIGGRKNDAIIAWVYISNQLNIRGIDLVHIIHDVKQEVLAPFRDDDKLRQIFEKEYSTLSVENTTFCSDGDNFSYRYYGPGTNVSLSDLLDERSQSYYQNYKTIFLLDKEKDLHCFVGDDLTNKKLFSSTIVQNPNKHKEFVPYINGKIADKPLRLTIGDRITITWKRNGYRTIKTDTEINSPTSWNYPSSSDIYRELYPNEIINVVDECKRHIDKPDLRINGETYWGDRPLYLRENETKIKLEVSAKGYDSLHTIFDIDKPYPITLKRKSYRYTFMLPYRTGQVQGESTIELTLNERLEECPFEGYTTKGYVTPSTNNYLIYNPKNKRGTIKLFLIIALVSLLIGGCGGFYLGYRVMVDDVEEVKKENNQLKEIKKKEQEKAEQDKKRKAEERKSAIRKYLDETNVWNRSKMETYSEIAGLWDALNERDFDKILTYRDYLKDSKRFDKVIEAIEKNKDKKFKEKYTQDNDITIEPVDGNKGYIKALNDATSPNSTKTPSLKEENKKKENTPKQGDLI